MENRVPLYATKDAEIEESMRLVAYIRPHKHLKGEEGYMRIFQSSLMRIAQDREATGETLRVFLGILACVEWDNTFDTSITSLGKELGMNRTAVSRQIRWLLDEKYLKKIGVEKCVNVYMLDPNVGFKTRSVNLGKLRQKFDDVKVQKAV